MNSLGGMVCVGAPRSIARYRIATRICADCVARGPEGLEYAPLQIAGRIVSVPGTCYVCEEEREVAVLAGA